MSQTVLKSAGGLPLAERLGERSSILGPLTVFFITFLLLVVGNVLAQGFATPDHILLLLALSSFLGIVAIGQTLVILTGGIDLSISWVITASAVLFTGSTLGHTDNLALGLAIALGFGLAMGLVNGVGVALVGISPIVMTLGMNSICQGLALIYTNGTPFGSAPPPIQALATEWFLNVPQVVIFWALVGAIAIAGLRLTRYGRMVYTFGENPLVSRLSGFNNTTILIAVYMLSGLSAGVTGVLFSGFSRASFLGMGAQFVMPSIAAVVLGGTSILGGRGGYGGTIIGAFFLTVLTTVLTIVNISVAFRSIIYGLVILAAILLNRLYIKEES